MKKLFLTLGIMSVTQCFADNRPSLNFPESSSKTTSIVLTGTIKYNDKYDKTSTKQYSMTLPAKNVKYAIMLVEFKTESEDYGINWGNVITNRNVPPPYAKNNAQQFGLMESNYFIESKLKNNNELNRILAAALNHVTTSKVVAILPL